MESRLLQLFILFSLVGCSSQEQPINVLRQNIHEVLDGKTKKIIADIAKLCWDYFEDK